MSRSFLHLSLPFGNSPPQPPLTYTVRRLLKANKLFVQMFLQHVHNGQKVEKPRSPLAGERINEMWHIRAMKYYSAIKEVNYMGGAKFIMIPAATGTPRVEPT